MKDKNIDITEKYPNRNHRHKYVITDFLKLTGGFRRNELLWASGQIIYGDGTKEKDWKETGIKDLSDHNQRFSNIYILIVQKGGWEALKKSLRNKS